MTAPEGFTTNLLLKSLRDSDLELLRPYLIRLPLEREQVLVTADEVIEHVWFLEEGVASVVARTRDHGLTEVGIFGRDGMSGSCVLLGTDRSPHDSFIQVTCANARGLRIPAEQLLAATRLSSSLQTALLRFVQCFVVQTASSAASNAHQQIEARLARWLLMCHDRVDGDEIALTHEFMGMMIAAERTGVTVTLHVLEGIGAIQSTRGRVLIRDRAKLEELAGDGYGLPERQYRQLIAPFGKGAVEE